MYFFILTESIVRDNLYRNIQSYHLIYNIMKLAIVFLVLIASILWHISSKLSL